MSFKLDVLVQGEQQVSPLAANTLVHVVELVLRMFQSPEGQGGGSSPSKLLLCCLQHAPSIKSLVTLQV